MSTLRSFASGQGTGKRLSHVPPMAAATLRVQAPVGAAQIQIPHYPFQPLPPPNGPAPYRFDLSQLLPAEDVSKIVSAGSMVFHTVGDTGDHRGRQQDFVAEMMTLDAQALPNNKKPAFFYHLGDVVYFAGDISMYGDNFYETYKDYPGFIVAIPGNHDCQPDDPQDGPVDPNKKPLDGWIQNFMSKDPTQPGSFKTGANRTQMDLPNVYWTFTTPFATIIGLFSNVGETEGEIHADQIAWFEKELAAAPTDRALIVTVHHPPFSGDVEHMGSSAVDKVLSQSFQAAKRYPQMILSGHVHNYQRFTSTVQGPKGQLQIPCIVAGAGGYTKLGLLQKVNGAYPTTPLNVGGGLILEKYDQTNFGFLRLEVSKTQILGTYTSAPYAPSGPPASSVLETFSVDLAHSIVTTGNGGGGGGTGPRPKPKPKPKSKSKKRKR
jgi:3',5'-cyclic AMP phosphodiesterase CpdA